MSELDLLRSLGDQVVPPPLDALRETARRRDRRNAMATLVASGAAAAVVTAGVVLLGVGDRDAAPGPVEPPAEGSTTHPLTYADGATVHYGDRTVDAGGEVVELDLTDDGVAFRTDDGRIWFTRGSDVEQIGAVGRTGPGYGDNAWPLMSRPGWMLSANEGSRLVWFEFPSPGEPEVVVYDTSSGREVARDSVTGPGHTALPALLSDHFVYWFRDPDPGGWPEDVAKVRYDPATGEQVPATERDLLGDLNGDAAVRSVRLRGDGACDSCPGFHYSDGMGLQMGLGLRKEVAGTDGVAPVGPGDMVAEDVDGEPFRFDPDPDDPGTNIPAWLVQWVDDRTVVVYSPRQQRTVLIACHLDTRACEVGASGPTTIVVPEVGWVDANGF